MNPTSLRVEEHGGHLASEARAILTEFEEEVFNFIKTRGEILTSSLPPRMGGAIPNLKNKGVIEVIKRRTSKWASKKRKFVKIRGSRSDS